ncbi:MAG: glucan 1,3-beta-glucosidase [Planctomycetota bacterium]|jgi:glucan 1,3-beta-glucosidase
MPWAMKSIVKSIVKPTVTATSSDYSASPEGSSSEASSSVASSSAASSSAATSSAASSSAATSSGQGSACGERRLDAVASGGAFEIVAVDGDDAISERLAASGLWVGAVLEHITSAPFGDPMLFRVHGYRLALRRSEAQRVRVVASSTESSSAASSTAVSASTAASASTAVSANGAP